MGCQNSKSSNQNSSHKRHEKLQQSKQKQQQQLEKRKTQASDGNNKQNMLELEREKEKYKIKVYQWESFEIEDKIPITKLWKSEPNAIERILKKRMKNPSKEVNSSINIHSYKQKKPYMLSREQCNKLGISRSQGKGLKCKKVEEFNVFAQQIKQKPLVQKRGIQSNIQENVDISDIQENKTQEINNCNLMFNNLENYNLECD